MENTVKQRLIAFIGYKGISIRQFEKVAGLSNGYMKSLRHAPSVEKMRMIIDAFPDLNKDWLEKGQGEMLTSNVTPVAGTRLEGYTVTKAGTRFYKAEDGRIVMRVPVVPIAALGSPADEWAELTADDSDCEQVMVEVSEVHHGSYIAFRVEGDSMDDGSRRSFERGDIVVVRELARDHWLPKLHYNKWPFWVVAFDNCVRLKQIVSQDEQGGITLHSLNPSPEYTDFTLQLDQVFRLFNVVQHIPHPHKF